MRNFISIIVILIAKVNFSYAQISNQLIINEDIRIGHSITFHSDVLNENRKINIYLPKEYNKNSNINYPVIYLLDGSIDKEFIPSIGLVKLLSSNNIGSLQESIVVGIESENRTSDFTSPTKVEQELNGFPPSGNSKKFIDFISDELIVLINDRYKVSSERTIVGNSLGGLLVSEILLTKSILFDNYILISPSLWWNNNNILELKTDKIIPNRKVYIAAWDKNTEYRTLYDRFLKKLKNEHKKSPKKKLQYYYQIFEENDHGNINHFAVYNGLKRLNQKESKHID